jgi:peptide/nickel transport system substrate-binding protein
MKKSFITLLSAAFLLTSCGNMDERIDEPVDFEEFEEMIPKTDIIIGITGMTGNFSPFYSYSAGDIDVLNVINVPLVTLDRRGEVVRNAAVGETRVFAGIEYYYEGIADTSISITENNTTVLTFRLREDIFFSDGVNMTADDVIFTLTTLLDRNYRGRYAEVGLLPILGLNHYKTNASPEIYEKYAELLKSDEPDEELSLDEEQLELYRECERQAWLAHIQAIIDYSVQNYAESAHIIADGDIYRDEWMQVALAMMVWRIADFPLVGEDYGNFRSVSGREWNLTSSFPTMIDMYSEFIAIYGGDLDAYISSERIGQPWLDNVRERAELLFIREMAARDEDNSGVSEISGIQRLGDYTVEVTLDGHIPAAVYAFVFPVVPRHHNNMPLGAGPYKLIGYNNGIAALEANEYYFKGAPGITAISFVETAPEDLIFGAASGELDIIAVTATRETLSEINAYSESGLRTQEFDYGAFGYIGFNAERISIDEEPFSEASINFRKGIATVFAAYRSHSVWDYYEDSARVAEYLIPGVSWAAPRQWDVGYRQAYGAEFDVRRAALEYFAAAGCELNEAETSIIGLPEGVSGNYEVYIVGYGAGRHPSFTLLTMAADTLRSIGINIFIKDVSSQAQMYEAVFNGTADIWCAAWQGELFPNTSSVFRSDGSENFFGLADEMIDRGIDLAGTSLNLEFYRNALDAILESAVAVPVYQRQRYFVFGSALDHNTIEMNLTAHYGWAEIIWQMQLQKIGG